LPVAQVSDPPPPRLRRDGLRKRPRVKAVSCLKTEHRSHKCACSQIQCVSLGLHWLTSAANRRGSSSDTRFGSSSCLTPSGGASSQTKGRAGVALGRLSCALPCPFWMSAGHRRSSKPASRLNVSSPIFSSAGEPFGRDVGLTNYLAPGLQRLPALRATGGAVWQFLRGR
jgi:hypothetical protein